MKKIVKETGSIRFTGNAGIDCICFKAHRTNGGFSLLRNSIAVYMNEKGEIFFKGEEAAKEERKKIDDTLTSIEEKYKTFFKKATTIALIMSIIIGFIDINLVRIISAIFLLMLALYFHPSILVLFIERIRGNKDVLRITRFHAAEHASINAYSDLKRVPTLEEVRNYSNYSYDCGSLEQIKTLTLMFLIAIFRLIPSLIVYMIVIAIVTLVFIYIPDDKFFFLQFLVTSNPTDCEYKVAIEGIGYALKGLETMESGTELSYSDKIRIFSDLLQGGHKFSEDVCKYCSNYKACKKLMTGNIQNKK